MKKDENLIEELLILEMLEEMLKESIAEGGKQ